MKLLSMKPLCRSFFWILLLVFSPVVALSISYATPPLTAPTPRVKPTPSSTATPTVKPTPSSTTTPTVKPAPTSTNTSAVACPASQESYTSFNSKDPTSPDEQVRKFCQIPQLIDLPFKGRSGSRLGGFSPEYKCCHAQTPSCAADQYCWKIKEEEIVSISTIPQPNGCNVCTQEQQSQPSPHRCPTGEDFREGYDSNGTPLCCNSSETAIREGEAYLLRCAPKATTHETVGSHETATCVTRGVQGGSTSSTLAINGVLRCGRETFMNNGRPTTFPFGLWAQSCTPSCPAGKTPSFVSGGESCKAEGLGCTCSPIAQCSVQEVEAPGGVALPGYYRATSAGNYLYSGGIFSNQAGYSCHFDCI